MLRFLIILLCSFSIVASGQGTFKAVADTAAFRQKVEKMSRETQTIESDFVQVKDLKVLSEKVTSKGHFAFQKKNNLRWEYSQPYKYTIVISQDRMLIKDENNKVKKYDMNSNKIFKSINDIMISCVNGEVFRSNKFKIASVENEKEYRVELIPLDKMMGQSLKRIYMYFDKAVTSVTKLEMFEPGDDVTSIQFLNKKINAPVAPQLFTLH